MNETEFGEEVGDGVDTVGVDSQDDVVDAWGSGAVVRGYHTMTLHRATTDEVLAPNPTERRLQ